MGTAPVITIFVRHSEDCKYAGDEFCRRCNCRKHFRWTQDKVQRREAAGTRSWEEAEGLKRKLQDRLAGRLLESEDGTTRTLESAIDLFIKDKLVTGIAAQTIGKYTRELDRLKRFLEQRHIFVIAGITRDVITDFASGWEAQYPSSRTRNTVKQRLGSFLKYCLEAGWLTRFPVLPKIKRGESPTLPLSDEEYERLLETVHGFVTPSSRADKLHALFQLMRWSGLALQDALTLSKFELQHDTTKGIYRIVTSRQKTGVDVTVPIRPEIAREVLAVAVPGEYIFWSGEGKPSNAVSTWTRHYITPVFKAAGLHGQGYMTSHRLRDTFAVDLLIKGVPIEEVSKMLGHTSVQTTEQHYAKWVKGRQDRLDSLVMETWKQFPSKKKSTKKVKAA